MDISSLQSNTMHQINFQVNLHLIEKIKELIKKQEIDGNEDDKNASLKHFFGMTYQLNIQYVDSKEMIIDFRVIRYNCLGMEVHHELILEDKIMKAEDLSKFKTIRQLISYLALKYDNFLKLQFANPKDVLNISAFHDMFTKYVIAFNTDKNYLNIDLENIISDIIKKKNNNIETNKDDNNMDHDNFQIQKIKKILQ